MKKVLTIASAVAAFALASTSTLHAELKVGFVDMNKVFSAYYKTKDAESRLNEATAAAKKELDERVETYQKNLTDLNKLNEEIARPELSKDAKDKKSKERDEKIAETKNLEREINEFRTTRSQQIQDQKLRRRNEIVEEITKVIQERVKGGQFDLVLDKSGNSLNGVPIILFSKDASDFSDDIIATLNKDSKGAAKDAPSTDAEPAKKK